MSGNKNNIFIKTKQAFKKLFKIKEKTMEENNKIKFIKDVELDNLDSGKDYLETKKYSDVLQSTIKDIYTPCTIGLFGEWGSGKSSIIRDVIDKLDCKDRKYKDDNAENVKTSNSKAKNQTSERIRFVVYDAWKYSKDSFRRTFLLEVAKELKFQEQDYFDMFYTNKSDEKIKYSLKIIEAFSNLDVEKLKKILTLKESMDCSSVLDGISNLANLITKTKETKQTPLIFAQEQFENLFDEMLEKSLGVKSLVERIIHFFNFSGYEINIDKLVIVIDNLDRCNADTVCEMLSDIKGFLNKDKVVFIVPLDDKMLKKHLSRNNGYEDSESSEYLRKIFDCVLSLKKTQEFDMYEVLTKLLDKHKIKYNPNTMSVISEEYASNPRRIIKFINNFEIEKELLLCKSGVDKEFIKTNETLIAFLLILKEEQYNLYQKILENISNIHTIGDDGGKENENGKNQSEDIKTENIYIKKFLEHTKIIWSKADLNVVDKLVCNLNTEDKLPYEIREKLKENEFGKIKQEEYAEASKHLVFSFNKWCERGAYKTKALSFFKQLIKANAYKMLSKSHFDDIYNKSEYALKELLEYIEDKEDIKNAIQFINSNYNKFYVTKYKESLKSHYSFIYKNINKNGFPVKDVFTVDEEAKSKYHQVSNIYKLGFEYFLNNQGDIQEDLEIYQECFYAHSYLNDYKPYLNLNDKVLKLIINESIINKLLQTKFKNRSDLHKLMQKLLVIEVINHSQYCKSIFNVEDAKSVRKLLTFRKFVKHNQSKNITLDGYTHLCVSCIKNCKKSSKEMLEFFIGYFNNDENLHIIINNILEQEKIFEKQSECIKYCFSRDIKLNIHIAEYFEEILLANKDNSLSIDILKDLYMKSFLSIYNDGCIRSIIEHRMYDIIQNIDSDIGKNMQNMLVELDKNQKLPKIAIDTIKEHAKSVCYIPPINQTLQEKRNKYAKFTKDFQERFLKGEQDA